MGGVTTKFCELRPNGVAEQADLALGYIFRVRATAKACVCAAQSKKRLDAIERLLLSEPGSHHSCGRSLEIASMSKQQVNKLRPRRQSAKGKATKHSTLADGPVEIHVFHYRLRPKRGLTADEEVAFEVRLNDFFRQRSLMPEGGPLRAWLSCPNADLIDDDCFEFLRWVVQDRAIAHLGLCRSQPENQKDMPRQFDISIDVHHEAVHATVTLYQMHRLSSRAALMALETSAPFTSYSGGGVELNEPPNVQ